MSCIWCAVSGNLSALHHTCYIFALPCSCGVRNTRCTPPKRNPKCMCLPSVAKKCMEGHEKMTVVSGTVGHTSEATLCERFGGFGNLYKRLTLECFDNEVIHVRFRQHAACCCWSSLSLATLLRRLSERCGQHVLVEDLGFCCASFIDFSLSVLLVPHVEEHAVPAVVWLDGLGTLLLAATRHLSGRHGGRKSSESQSFSTEAAVIHHRLSMQLHE